MNDSRQFTVEDLLYAAAFVLAIVLRLFRLGVLPLSDGEATWALQALGVAQGGHPLIGAQPGYVTLTALSFFLFSSSNFLARLLPALMGGLLVLVPYFFRDRLGALTAVICAFALAIDPGLVALSRTAGSPMFAVGAVLLAGALWHSGHRAGAGFFAGLALLAGLPLWAGLLGLGITWLLLQGAARLWNTEGGEGFSSSFAALREELAPTFWVGAGTFVLVGSLFFLAPNGLSAALLAVPTFFRSWVTPSDVPPLRLLLALASYEPMAVIFGLIGLVRGLLRRDALSIGLGIWFVAALLVALAYPGRTPGDLAWAVIPLWALAAGELARHLRLDPGSIWEVLGMLVLTLAILTFVWLDIAALANHPDPQTLSQRGMMLGGALGLLAISAVLVGLGWNADVARMGTVWGASLTLGVYTFGMMWSAAGLRPVPTFELWSADPTIVQSGILLQTVSDLSEYNHGVTGFLPVAVIGVDSPALRWLLRDSQVSDQIDPVNSTPIVIATDDPNASFSASYRGQDFTWRAYPGWDTAAPLDWLSWLSTRQIPFGEEKIILWARGDLFKDAPSTTP